MALAALFAFASCGTSPAQVETEEATTETVTQPQTATAAFTFSLPELPVIGAENTPAQSAAAQPAASMAMGTRTAALSSTTVTTKAAASGATSKTTTTTAKSSSYSYTQSTAATTTTKAGTSSQTSTTTTQQSTTQRRTFSVSVDNAKAAGSAQMISVTVTNSVGTTTTRRFTGVRLKDFLATQGVNMSALNASATLIATATDGETMTYSRGDIISDKTLLAWEEDGKALSPPRLCPCDSTVTGDYLKEVVSITLIG